jgi:CubicO group peptidase (beta-lactamase class C family)
MKLLPTILLSTVVLTSVAQPYYFPDARRTIEYAVNKQNHPSISIAVVKDGKIIWEEGFGYADRENKRKATPHTPYYTASISKTLTATALMKMAEQKLINIDSPVNKYLKGWKVSSYRWDANKATIKSVMSHTSGLTTFNFWCRTDSLSCAKMDKEIMTRYAKLLSTPGHFDYSNIGYGVLDHLISDVSGVTYAEYMNREVFDPLGMKNTFVARNPLPADRAIRYAGDAESTLTEFPFSHSFSNGASSVFSSVHDLALFATLHLNDMKKSKAIISPASVNAMQDTVARNGSQHYGLAWWVNNDFNGYKGLLAQGGTFFAQAWVELIPSEDIAVVILGNNGNGSPYRTIINDVLAELLPKFKANMLAAKNKPKEEKQEQPVAAPPPSKWKGVIKTYKGDIPVSFNLNGVTESTATFRTDKEIKLSKVNIEPHWYSYNIDEADLELEDMGRGPYRLHFYLSREGDELYGSVQTSGTVYPDTPGLSFWVEMKKTE